MIPLFDCSLPCAKVASSEMGCESFGQLVTPLTQYRNWGDGVFGIDNGAFSGFLEQSFLNTLNTNSEHRDRCRFVACPDVVGDAKATDRLFDKWCTRLAEWPLALVTQDGLRLQDVPWANMAAVFVGGTDRWKFCPESRSICLEAKRRGLWLHVGRVNNWQRAMEAERLGADSFDGTGIVRFSGMRAAFRDGMAHPRLPLEVGA